MPVSLAVQPPGSQVVKRTASRPVPYQPSPSHGNMLCQVIELIEYLEYWSEVFLLCPLCHLMEDNSDL